MKWMVSVGFCSLFVKILSKFLGLVLLSLAVLLIASVFYLSHSDFCL